VLSGIAIATLTKTSLHDTSPASRVCTAAFDASIDACVDCTSLSCEILVWSWAFVACCAASPAFALSLSFDAW
jgi:hypothetical protein